MKRLFSFFLLVVITWALGEILVRVFIPLDLSKRLLDFRTDHPYIRAEWAPNFERDYSIDGIGGQTGSYHLKINPFGFRSASMKTAQKPAGTYRIFFLGGSTTEEIALPEEKTFPFLVEKRLSVGAIHELPLQFKQKKFESVNAGISGFLAADCLALLTHKVLYYQPDLIFMMEAVNDLRYGTIPSFDPIERPNYRKKIAQPENETVAQGFKNILRRSHFLTLIKWRILNRIFRPEAEKYQTALDEYNANRRKRREVPFSTIEQSKSLEDYVKHLEEIIFIAKGHGVRLILMTEPFIYRENLPPEIDEKLWMGYMGEASGVNLSNAFMFREMNRFNDAVRALSQKHQVELIDLEKEIPKDLNHFYDDVHLTPQGAAKASEVIADYLLKNPKSF